jgi:hypothetical protein
MRPLRTHSPHSRAPSAVAALELAAAALATATALTAATPAATALAPASAAALATGLVRDAALRIATLHARTAPLATATALAAPTALAPALAAATPAAAGVVAHHRRSLGLCMAMPDACVSAGRWVRALLRWVPAAHGHGMTTSLPRTRLGLNHRLGLGLHSGSHRRHVHVVGIVVEQVEQIVRRNFCSHLDGWAGGTVPCCLLRASGGVCEL